MQHAILRYDMSFYSLSIIGNHMAKRLHERFVLGEEVEIYFPQVGLWLPGKVVRFDAPGVWVETFDGRPWFVTNGRRIRPQEAGETERGE